MFELALRLAEHHDFLLRRLQAGIKFGSAQREFACRHLDAGARTEHALLGSLDAGAALACDQHRQVDPRLLLARAVDHGVRRAAGGPRAAIGNGRIGQGTGGGALGLRRIDADSFHGQPGTARGDQPQQLGQRQEFGQP